MADAILNIDLDQELSKYQLTSDQQYLCKAMNTKLPLLPVVGKEENQLFEKLVLSAPQGPINFEQTAIEWGNKVDGINIFPKLPVYLHKKLLNKLSQFLLCTKWIPSHEVAAKSKSS